MGVYAVAKPAPRLPTQLLACPKPALVPYEELCLRFKHCSNYKMLAKILQHMFSRIRQYRSGHVRFAPWYAASYEFHSFFCWQHQ